MSSPHSARESPDRGDELRHILGVLVCRSLTYSAAEGIHDESPPGIKIPKHNTPGFTHTLYLVFSYNVLQNKWKRGMSKLKTHYWHYLHFWIYKPAPLAEIFFQSISLIYYCVPYCIGCWYWLPHYIHYWCTGDIQTDKVDPVTQIGSSQPTFACICITFISCSSSFDWILCNCLPAHILCVIFGKSQCTPFESYLNYLTRYLLEEILRFCFLGNNIFMIGINVSIKLLLS